MKAVDYIKTNGIDYARDRLDYCKNAVLVGIEIDLKEIVTAFDLVEKHNGLNQAKDNLCFARKLNMKMIFGDDVEVLDKAINIVEQCYE